MGPENSEIVRAGGCWWFTLAIEVSECGMITLVAATIIMAALGDANLTMIISLDFASRQSSPNMKIHNSSKTYVFSNVFANLEIVLY